LIESTDQLMHFSAEENTPSIQWRLCSSWQTLLSTCFSCYFHKIVLLESKYKYRLQ